MDTKQSTYIGLKSQSHILKFEITTKQRGHLAANHAASLNSIAVLNRNRESIEEFH